MKFQANYDDWEIIRMSTNDLLDIYRKEVNEEATFAFGVCKYPEHRIIINKDMCEDQQIKTLKHELTHLWIFSTGLFNVPHYTEEMVCDLVMNINDFINDVIEKFRREFKFIR